jgi:hypothetical protein
MVVLFEVFITVSFWTKLKLVQGIETNVIYLFHRYLLSRRILSSVCFV